MFNLSDNILSSNAVDLGSIVKLALKQKLSWSTLKLFLHELTSTLEASKQLNVILLEELQVLHSKTIDDQTQDTPDTILEYKEQDTVENGSDDDEIMVLFTKQETIEDEHKPIDNHQTDDDSYGSNNYEIEDHNDKVLEYDLRTEDNISNVDEVDTEDTAYSEESSTNGTHDLIDNEILIPEEGNQAKIDHDDKTQERKNMNSNGKVEQESNDQYSSIRKEKKNHENKTVIVNGEKRYSCENCGQLFAQLYKLQVHERIHTGEKPFECKHCAKRFNQSQNLKIHERIHTGEKPFECKHCAKRFAHSQHLKIHARIHTGYKPFKCQICLNEYYTRSDFVSHLKAHSGDTPFGCKSCPKMFKSKIELRLHTRIHTGEKPFQCNTCRKSFSQSCNLITHQRFHSGEKPYECLICKKKFFTSSHLKNHQRIHTK